MTDRAPVKASPLTLALGVNGIVLCDCGKSAFKIGIAVNMHNGNNFMRVLECVACGHQMPATHTADSSLAPVAGFSKGNRQ